jgi:hypothetical protein
MTVDLDLVNYGECSSPMQLVLQEIDIIMTCERYQLIHAKDAYVNTDSYLFKTGLNTEAIASSIETKLNTNVGNPEHYYIKVEAGYLPIRDANELLLINITVTSPTNDSAMLQYATSSTGIAL